MIGHWMVGQLVRLRMAFAVFVMSFAMLPAAAWAACENALDFSGAAVNDTRVLDVSTCSLDIRWGLYRDQGDDAYNYFPVSGDAFFTAAPDSAVINLPTGAQLRFTPLNTQSYQDPSWAGPTTIVNSYTVTLLSTGTGANSTATLYHATNVVPQAAAGTTFFADTAYPIAVTFVVPLPEIAVSGSIGGAVLDGETSAQGNLAVGTPVTVTYTVTNTGNANLTLATATAASPSGVTVGNITAPVSTTVAGGGGTTTFQVTYTPTAVGPFSFNLSFVNNDSDENPFNFTVSGTGVAPVLSLSLGTSGTPTQGQNFDLTAIVGNGGSAATSGAVTLSSTLPTGFTYGGGWSGFGWDCSASNGANLTCSWSTPIAAPGFSSQLFVAIAVAPTSPISQTVSVTASGGGASSSDNRNQVVTVTQTPASVSVNAGDNQTAALNAAFGTPLSVIVRDAAFGRIANVPVTFAAPGSGASGSFSGSPTVTTNGVGVATAPTFTANGIGGSFQVSATAGSASANFSLANVSPLLFSVSFSPTSIPADGTSSSILSIRIENPNAGAVTGVAVAASALPAGLTGNGGSLSATCPGTPVFDGGAGTLRFENGTIGGNVVCNVELEVTSLTPGSYGYTTGAVSSDQTGTGSTATTPTQLAVIGIPTVTGLSPAFGPTAGGTVVTITGTNLLGATGVSFGATPAAGFTVDSATQITATAPAGSGKVDVRVVGPGGTSGNTANDDFNYIVPPTVSVEYSATTTSTGTPSSVTLTLGNPNEVALTNLTFQFQIQPGTAAGTPTAFDPTSCFNNGDVFVSTSNSAFVRLTERSGLSLAANSTCTMTLSFTPNTTGTYSVISATMGATEIASAPISVGGSNSIEVRPPVPTVTAVSPAFDNIAGGTVVTITGTDFTGATAVSFGATPATSFIVDSATQIRATSPAGAAGTVNVSVTTPGGTSADNGTADDFEYGAPPVRTGDAAVQTGTGYSWSNPDIGTAAFLNARFTGAIDGFYVGSGTDTSQTVGGVTLSIAASGATTVTRPTGFRGTVEFEVRAFNRFGASAPLTWSIAHLNPVLNASLSGTGARQGTALSGYTIATTGGNAPYGCATTPATGTLPNGVTINADCSLTGTPTETGTFDFTLDVTDSSIGPGAGADTAANPFTQTSGTLSLVVLPPAPVVTGVSPSAGAIGLEDGTPVTITGTNLSGATGVSFGGLPASGFTVNPAGTEITVRAPSNFTTGTVNVTVTTPGGTSADNGTLDDFTYLPAPVLTVTLDADSQQTLGRPFVVTVTPSVAAGGADTSGELRFRSDFNTADFSASASGAGWTCGTGTSGGNIWTCTTSDVIAAGASGNPILVTLTPLRVGSLLFRANLEGANAQASANSQRTFTINAAPQTAAAAGPFLLPVDVAASLTPVTRTEGGTAPFAWSVDPALPAGLTFDPGTGAMGGTPTAITAAQDHTITLTDARGATSAQTVSLGVIPPAPVVTGLSPALGLTAGGTSVIITGTNFTGATAVSFGGTAATAFTVDSATQITATAPAGAAGTVNVSVTAPGGTSADAGTADDFEYGTAPVRGNDNPISTSSAYGAALTFDIPAIVLESAFSGSKDGYYIGSGTVSSQTLGGVSLTANPDGSVTIVRPANYRGQVQFQIRAFNRFGESLPRTWNHEVRDPVLAPSLSGTGARQGTALSGYAIATTGGAAPYSCATTPATGTLPAGVTINADCTLSGTPTESGSFDFTLDVTDSSIGPGVGADTTANPFTQASGTLSLSVLPPVPVVTGLSPAEGPTTGGTTVTITGTDLLGATAVSFGATPAATFTVDSATQITATSPAGVAGPVNVSVVTIGGTSANTAADDFTYVAAPAIAGLSPAEGPETGGTVVIITGTDLLGATAVSFGATPATSFTVDSATQITATSPAGAAGTVNVSVVTVGGTSANTGNDDFTYVAAPAIAGLRPAEGPTTGGTAVTITGTNLLGATAVSFGGTPATSFVVDSATQITATSPAGTAGTVDVSVVTIGGTSANTAADDFTYVAAPAIASLNPAEGPTTGGTVVTITGTNLLGATAVSFGATPATSFTVDSATQITATSPAGVAGTVDVSVVTVGGTSANTGNDDFTYVAAPAIAGLSPAVGPTTGGTVVTITGTGFIGATAVSFGGTPATSFVVDSATQITATSPAGTTGTVDVSVITVGGTSANTGNDDFAYVAAPAIAGLSPTEGPATGGTVVTITGTDLLGATAVSFGGTPATSFTVDSATQITATSPAGTAGTVDVSVVTVGGTSANTAADDFTYVAAPAIAGLSPAEGPATGGTVVTITGTNLLGATAVSFGGTPAASFTVDSAAQITATSPAGVAGIVDVSVVTIGGTSANTGNDDFTYVAAPAIASLSPTEGPTTGGTVVIITGTDLLGATAVSFGATPAATFTVDSATQITATSPAGTAGTVDVSVVTVGGTSANTAADDFTYVAAPAIAGLNPTEGPTTGGTVVTITGTNLLGATAVSFGGTPATSFTVDSATQITATSPAGAAGTIDVSVVTIGGASANTAADDFTYVAAPAIASLSPAEGPATGGTVVTITGTNLLGATAVSFGGTPATSFVVDSATQITATSPAGVAGTVDVSVVTVGGTSANTAAADFAYLAAPAIASLSPAEGRTTGGTLVTITGTDLGGVTSVNFGATPAVSVIGFSATRITAVSPAGVAGTVDVSVTTGGGTSANTAADDFTYVAAPAVTGLSPNAGPEAGGTVVTITGTALLNAGAVNFGATPAASFTVDSATQITATSPAGAAGIVDVSIVTVGGISANTAADDFTYVAPPAVTGLSPAFGDAFGGTVVTITGTGFSGATAVTFASSVFGLTPAAGFTVVSDTQITATTPIGFGQSDVLVTTPGGTSSHTGTADDFVHLQGVTFPTFELTANPVPADGVTRTTLRLAIRDNNVFLQRYTWSLALPAGLRYIPETLTADAGCPLLMDIDTASFGFTNQALRSDTCRMEVDIIATAPGEYWLETSAIVGEYITSGSGRVRLNATAALPTVTAVSPALGLTVGGTAVTIDGTNFIEGATSVSFGGTAATGVTFVSATRMTATAPAGALGAVNVTVTTPSGTSADAGAADDFTYGIGPSRLVASSATNILYGDPNPVRNDYTLRFSWFRDGYYLGATGTDTSATIAGVNFSVGSNGVLTIDRPAGWWGTATAQIRAYNAFGASAPHSVVFTVANPDLSISLTGSGAQAGAALSGYAIETSGGAAPYVCATVPATGSLPAGVSINADCTLTGTPTESGDFGFTLDVTDSSVGPAGANAFTQQSGALTLSVLPAAPAIAGLSPTEGPTTGGTVVTVTGTGFTGATAVSFGATPATSFVVDGATQITATSPAGVAGTVDVSVVTISGTSANTGNDDFTYVAAPAIADLSPTEGPETGGTVVTITGTGFTGATAVSFGATPATSFTVDSATQITATSPAGAAGTVDVSVVTIGGTSANTAADDFTYVAAPAIAGLSPAEGPETGGTVVTITGTDLLGATAVSFGGTPATSFTVDSATQITATSPAGVAGTVDVSLVTVGGTSANTGNDDFTYVAAPAIAGLSPAEGPTTGGTVVTITGTGFTGATAVSFGGTPATSFTVDSATQITATSPAGIAGIVDVSVVTVGGTSANTGNDDFTYVGAPAIAGLSPAEGPTAGGTVVTITGTDLLGATAVSFGATPATSFVVDSATQITATSPAGVAGTVDVSVVTIGGTSANTANDDFTYVAAPAIAGLSPTQGPTTGGTVVTITGTNLLGATAVSFGATPAATFTVDSATQITATSPAGVAGTVDVSVVTIGGTSANTAADDFTFVSAPAIAGLSPAEGPTTGGTVVTITGTNLLGATAVSFGATPATSFVVDSATQITATSPAGGAGTVNVSVVTVGGTSANTAADDFTYIAAPAIAGLSPAEGPTTGGTVVTITGTGFTGATAVSFGGTPATSFVVDSATQITATSPAGVAGIVDVSVVTIGGTSANTAADDFTYVAAPAIAGLSPAEGPETGGTVVTITGTNLLGATAVSFGATPATSFTVDSATQITATSPAGVAGTVDVSLVTVGGTSANTGNDDFTYVAAPAIVGLSPTEGPAAGGTVVTITGTDLLGATAVSFGGTPATSFVVDSATQITATSPAGGAGTVNVSVVTVGGASANTANDDFTYVAAPAIAGLSPAEGPETGGTVVTVTGTGFTGATAVSFGATPAAIFTVDSATQITATSPAGVAGTVDVSVVTIGGTSANTANDDFTYVAAPAIAGLSPAEGPETGGTVVTVTGTGFTGATAVSFGATPAAIFTVDSATQITATSPAGTAGTVDVSVVTVGGTSANTAADDFAYIAAPGLTSFSVATTVPYNDGSGQSFGIDVASGAAPTGNPTDWSVISGLTPGGGTVSIDAAGRASYTPAAGFRGPDSFAVTAINAGGPSTPTTISMTVGNPALSASIAQPNGMVGVDYGQQVILTGGMMPYSDISATGLPPGLQIDATGLISGTPTAAGTFSAIVVTATDSSIGSGPFTGTAPAISFAIGKGAQAIVFAAPADRAFEPGATVVLSATGGASGNPVTFASASPSVCATSGANGETATLLAAGSCAIVASQAGNDDFEAAPDVTQSFAIGKGAQAIVFAAPADRAFEPGAAVVLSATGGASGNPVTFASASPAVCATSGANGETATLLAAGSCAIVASQAGNDDFEAAPDVTQSFAIGKGAQAIVFAAPADRAFEPGAAVVLSATGGASGNPVTFASASPAVCATSGANGETATLLAAGSCAIVASQAGNDDFEAAPDVTQSFAIGKGAQAIVFAAPADRAFEPGAAVVLSATGGASGNPVTFASASPSVCATSGANGETATLLAAGSCAIVASQAGNDDFEAAPDVTQSFAIGKGAQAIVFAAPADRAFEPDATVVLSATGGASGNPVTFASASPSVCATSGANGETATLLAAGSCAIVASQAGNDDFEAAPDVTQSFAIGKGAQAIVFAAPADRAFEPGATVVLSATGGASGNPVTFASASPAVCATSGANGETATLLAAGSCAIVASQAGNDDFEAAPDVTQSFAIGKGAQAIVFAAPADRAFEPGATVVLSATGGASGNPVTFASASPSVYATSGANGETATLLAAGTCAIVASQAGNDDFEAAPDVTQSFAIGKGAQAIVFAAPADRAFEPGATVVLSATGGASGNPVTFASASPSVCATSGANGETATLLAAGTCAIVASQAGNDDFEAAPDVTQSFAVGKGANTISFPKPADTGLSDAAPALAATASSGLAVAYRSESEAVCTVTPSGVLTLRAVGACRIEASQPGDDSWSAAAPVAQTFAVLDDSRPTVVLSGAPASVGGAAPFTVTATFSEPVTGFSASDVAVTNGAARSLVPVDDAVYLIEIVPGGGMAVEVSVPGDVAYDASGNGNEPSGVVSVASTTIADTGAIIDRFLLERARGIVGSSPDILGFLHGRFGQNGGSTGSFAFAARPGYYDFAFGASIGQLMQFDGQPSLALDVGRADAAVDPAWPDGFDARRFDAWFEVKGRRSSRDGSDQTLWIGSGGAHYFINPDILVGVMAQVDQASDEGRGGSTVSGHGWLVGPYAAGRFPGANMEWEARLAWGASDNEITPYGTYTDRFDTTRFLASGKLAGNWQIGSMIFTPATEVIYFREEQEAYVDSLSNTIPGREVELGEVKFGPTIGSDILFGDGTRLSPTVGVKGIWTFADSSGGTSSTLEGTLRARIDLGIDLMTPLGWELSLLGYYDGIGVEDYEAAGGSVRLGKRF
jgi:hypothetical protein